MVNVYLIRISNVVLNAECFKKYRNTKNKKKPFTLTLSVARTLDIGTWFVVGWRSTTLSLYRREKELGNVRCLDRG